MTRETQPTTQALALSVVALMMACSDDDPGGGFDASPEEDAAVDASRVEDAFSPVDAFREPDAFGEAVDASPPMDGALADAFEMGDGGPFGGCAGLDDGTACGADRICVDEICGLAPTAIVTPADDSPDFAADIAHVPGVGVVVTDDVPIVGPQLVIVSRDAGGAWSTSPWEVDFGPAERVSYWGSPLAASGSVVANFDAYGGEGHLVTMVESGGTWSASIDTVHGGEQTSALAVDGDRVIAGRGTSSEPATSVFRVTAGALQSLADLPEVAAVRADPYLHAAGGLVVTSNADGVHALTYDAASMSYTLVDSAPSPDGFGRAVATDGRFVVTTSQDGLFGPITVHRFELVSGELQPAGTVTLSEELPSRLGDSIAIDGAHVLLGRGDQPFAGVIAYVDFDTGAVEALAHTQPKHGRDLLWHDGLALATSPGVFSGGELVVHDVGR